MTALLHEAQESYPDQPAGPHDAWWLPVRLGGTAPTPERAAEMDAADARRRADAGRAAREPDAG